MTAERVAPISYTDMLRRLDWRQEGLGIAMVTAEAFPIYLIASLLVIPADLHSTFPFWVVLFLMLTSHLVCRMLDEMHIWSPEYEIRMGIGVVLTLIVSMRFASFGHYGLFDFGWIEDAMRGLAFLPSTQERQVWGIVAMVVYAWWRGRSRAEPAIDSAFTQLRWGSAAMVIAVVGVRIGTPGEAAIRDHLNLAMLGFFSCALVAIAIARLKLEGVRSSAPLGARWLGTFFAPILAVLVAAILVAGIFSRQFLDTVLWLLTPVFWVLGIVFQVLILIVAILAFIILSPIFWLIGEREIEFAPPDQPTEELEPQPGIEQAVEQAFQLPDPLRYLIAAIALFAIISLLTRFVFKRKGRSRPPTGEVRESVLDINDLLGNIGDRLRGMFRRQRQEDPLAHLRGDETWRHTLRIRETWMKLQARGEAAGRARRRSETAGEYGHRVPPSLGVAQELTPAVDAITERYRKARYSGRPAAAADADIVEVNWETIERLPRPDA